MSATATAEAVTLEAPPADATPQAEAPQPAEAWPPAVLWKAELQLQPGGAGEVLLALRMPPLDEGFVRAIFSARAEATAALPAAREAALSGPEHAKAVRLAHDLAEAQRAAREAGERSRHALAWARQALAEGNDPTPHEEAFRTGKLDNEVMANRAAALEQLAAEARQLAAQTLARGVEAARRRLHVAALAEADQLQKAFVEGCAALLQPLLAARWKAEWFGQEAVRGLVDLPAAGE
jgi:hypothetical protein